MGTFCCAKTLPEKSINTIQPSGLVELGYDGTGIGAAIPNGYIYSKDAYCWYNSANTVFLYLSDTRTYSSTDEMESAMSGKTARTENLGSYTVHVVEEPDNFGGPTTYYYVELAGVGGYAGCRVKVGAIVGGKLSDTQTGDIKDMIASITINE